MLLNRRGFLGGLLAVVAAPAIVRATSLMPVHSIEHLKEALKPKFYAVLNPNHFNDLVKAIEYGVAAISGIPDAVLGETQGVKFIDCDNVRMFKQGTARSFAGMQYAAHEYYWGVRDVPVPMIADHPAGKLVRMRFS